MKTGMRKTVTGVLALMLTLVLGALPAVPTYAQKGKGKGGKPAGHSKSRSSVSQSRKSGSSTRHHHHRPPARPPHRPPGYRPPPPRPPHYHPKPPRYRGSYYRDYSAWHVAAGVAAGIVVGTILGSRPPQAQTVVVKEVTYYVHEGVYYQPVMYENGTAYQVVPAP